MKERKPLPRFLMENNGLRVVFSTTASRAERVSRFRQVRLSERGQVRVRVELEVVVDVIRSG